MTFCLRWNSTEIEGISLWLSRNGEIGWNLMDGRRENEAMIYKNTDFILFIWLCLLKTLRMWDLFCSFVVTPYLDNCRINYLNIVDYQPFFFFLLQYLWLYPSTAFLLLMAAYLSRGMKFSGTSKWWGTQKCNILLFHKWKSQVLFQSD